MEAFSHFVEIEVAGILLLLALWPLVRLAGVGYVPPPLSLLHPKAQAALFVVIAFVIGVAGNQLLDEASDNDLLGGDKEAKCCYKKHMQPQAFAFSTVPLTLKNAEFRLGDAGDYTREFIERHRAFIRALRAAAFASTAFAIFGLTAAAARARCRKRSDWIAIAIA